MNELIQIEVKDGKQLVSGRELHKFLEVGTRYDVWINRIIEKYNFIENKDFIVVDQKRSSNEIKGYTEFEDHLMIIVIDCWVTNIYLKIVDILHKYKNKFRGERFDKTNN